MERWGLVEQIEADLERIISLGLLPEDRKLPSERTLASQYDVSRGTAREVLVRLRARGLIEVRPGRRARAVVMEREVRLEHLGVALLGEGPSHPERRALLAGYLELKRQVLVELLAACCEEASEEELERVLNACFLLEDAVHWEMKRPQWLALEFELLRQAAVVAQRPGQWLLIQTLEEACRGMAGRVEPYLDSAALYWWTQCAMEALGSKDVKALRSRLPALLRVSDERVLQALAPTCEAHGVASLIGMQRQEPAVEASGHPTLVQAPEVSEPAEALLAAPQSLVASERAQAPLSSALAPEVGQPAPELLPAGGTGALCANWSSLRTSWREVPPGGAPAAPAAPAPAAPGSAPSTGGLWLRSPEEDSWPWPTRGRTPGRT